MFVFGFGFFFFLGKAVADEDVGQSSSFEFKVLNPGVVGCHSNFDLLMRTGRRWDVLDYMGNICSVSYESSGSVGRRWSFQSCFQFENVCSGPAQSKMLLIPIRRIDPVSNFSGCRVYRCLSLSVRYRSDDCTGI